MTLARVAGGCIETPEGRVLDRFDLEVPERGVTAFMGPSGTGKSLALRALAGRLGPPARAGGVWEVAGADVTRAAGPDHLVTLCPQLAHGRPVEPGRWRAPLQSGARLVLLDEPTAGLERAEIDELVHALRARARTGAVVMVTHDLGFARASADRVAFFCAGTVQAVCRGEDFFRRPPSELAARFVATGNCWPARPPPALPDHFHWIIEGGLAGMAQPGLLRDVEDDLTAIALAGVTLVVSLTETPQSISRLRAFGLAGRHLPIADMGVPAIGAASSVCGYIDHTIERGGAVAVHCRAGLGRTGMMLASVLCWRGASPGDAIARVRAVVPGYIQNQAQLEFVHRFAETIQGGG